MPYWKFFGLKARRVCKSCFDRPIKISPKMLFARECGLSHLSIPKSLAVSKEELYDWFDGMRKYTMRDDAENYLVNDLSYNFMIFIILLS